MEILSGARSPAPTSAAVINEGTCRAPSQRKLILKGMDEKRT